MPKILVTGVNGFVGKHLVRELKGRGAYVVGLGREPNTAPEIADLLDKYWLCDLADEPAVAKLQLKEVDGVINLAGLARVNDPSADPKIYNRINAGALANLCKAIEEQDSRPRVIAVSTAYIYDPNQPMPLTEKSKLISQGSPYAMSKKLMEETVQDFRARGLDCIIVRPFNHIGPGQEMGFLVPDLYQKLVEAKKGGGTIAVGNLNTKRDYTDVRDVVKAYSELVSADNLKHDIYNICSDRRVSGIEILNLLKHSLGLEQIGVETDKSLLRANEVMESYGSYQRLHQATGWQPEIPLEKTIADFVKAAA